MFENELKETITENLKKIEKKSARQIKKNAAEYIGQQPHYKMAKDLGSKNIIVCHFVNAATRYDRYESNI